MRLCPVLCLSSHCRRMKGPREVSSHFTFNLIVAIPDHCTVQQCSLVNDWSEFPLTMHSDWFRVQGSGFQSCHSIVIHKMMSQSYIISSIKLTILFYDRCIRCPQINDRYEFPLTLDLDRENGKYLSPDADKSVRNLYSLHRCGREGGEEVEGRMVDGGWGASATSTPCTGE